LGVLGGVLICLAGLWAQDVGRVVAITGFTLVGIGIAVVVPLAFSAAGHSAKTPAARAHAIAGVATVAYGAGLAAPGIIGGIASATSLTASFAVVTVLIVVMTLAAPALRNAGAHGAPDEVSADAEAAGRTPARA
jgi:MFS family permease